MDPPASGRDFGSTPYRWYVLLTLTLVYTLNFIDRALLGVLAQPVLQLRDGPGNPAAQGGVTITATITADESARAEAIQSAWECVDSIDTPSSPKQRAIR